MREVLGFDEARAKLLEMVTALGAERVSLAEARGRFLAEEVIAPRDLPPFDHSTMDGYAVRAAELPATLPVRGEARAGGDPPALAKGTACRIFTGARIPAGADTVVMQEKVERRGDDATFAAAPKEGANIRRRGEDLAAGKPALPRGTRLGASHVALAATVDRAWLHVTRRPVVSVLATGDELRAPGTPGGEGSIPECNALAVSAMAEAAGALPRIAPIVGDDRAATERALEEALRGADVLVTVGGASVGDHDLVKPSLEAIGVALDFWKVAMKPGKPIMIGRRGHAFVVGLPGNPSSAMVTFALFGLPLLLALQGAKAPIPAPLRARLARAVPHEPGRREFVRATLASEAGGLVATPIGNQSSGAVTSMAFADALVVVPEGEGALPEGATVDALSLRELGL